MKYSEWPGPGELVVGKIDDITDFGVLVGLEEYEDERDLCHISRVASGWTKDIRDHVHEGQAIVAKILEINKSSQQIDLPIKNVNKHQRKEKIQEWKDEQKADKWVALAFDEDIADDHYQSTTNALLAEFESLYDGFERATIHGIEALDDIELDDDGFETIVETARQNVSVPYVNVTGYIDLRSPAGDGADDVKEALKVAEGDGEIGDKIKLSITYVDAPEYRVRVKASDYKTIEAELESSVTRTREAIEAAGGTVEHHRERSGDEE